ncbi:MAG: GTP cyclohydrolase I [Myxococcales bacterium]|nr:MAG: GTP cyclohydrolase I [Myxococcales bacterium]
MKQFPLKDAANSIRSFLQQIGAPVGEDPELAETGARVAQAFYEELLSGYRQDPTAILRDATASNSDALVVLKNVRIFPICPHHLLPNPGFAHIAYKPAGRVIGLGALARLLQCFSRRLILQEELAKRCSESIVEELNSPWAACVIDAEALCLTARGARAESSRSTIVHVAGEKKDDSLLLQTFWNTIKSH